MLSYNEIRNNYGVSDLRHATFDYVGIRLRYEYRTPRVFAVDGLDSPATVPKIRGTSSRELQDPDVLLLGPVSVYGVCTVDVSRKPARYCWLPDGLSLIHI